MHLKPHSKRIRTYVKEMKNNYGYHREQNTSIIRTSCMGGGYYTTSRGYIGNNVAYSDGAFGGYGSIPCTYMHNNYLYSVRNSTSTFTTYGFGRYNLRNISSANFSTANHSSSESPIIYDYNWILDLLPESWILQMNIKPYDSQDIQPLYTYIIEL